GYYRWIRRITCFEQLSYPWQTSCDISGFSSRARNLSNNLSFFHLQTVADGNVSSYRNIIGTNNFTILAQNFNSRVLSLIPSIDNHLLTVSGLFVRFFSKRNTLNNS